MTIQTDYGTVEYSQEDLITFTDGLFGFPKLTNYLLLRVNEEEGDNGDLSYYAICVVKNDYLENTVNLKCPLVINPQTRCGIQIILGNTAYEYSHKLGSFPSIMDSNTVSDRSNDLC